MSKRTLNAISFTVAVICLAAIVLGVLMMLSGCQPTVASPRDPAREVSIEQARLEADQIAAEKQSEARKADQRFAIAVKRLQATTEIDLAELTAAHDETVEKSHAEATAIRASTELAIKAAEDRQAAWLSGIGSVAGIAQASGVPGLATFGGLLAGGLGLFSAASNKRKAKSAEEAQAATESAAARVVDSIDILKMKAPEVAAAMKTHARDLIEWQGAAGMSLVSRIQHA